MERFQVLKTWLLHTTADFGLLEWGVTGAVLVTLMLAPFLTRGGRRTRRRPLPAVPMHLTFHAFQLAPLGRDGLLKIRNTGEEVVLLSAGIKGARGVLVKSALAGHTLGQGKVYGIFFEAEGKERLARDFECVLTYADTRKNVFSQSFFPELKGAKTPKRIRKG
jgi:hypothetical protein